MSLVGWGQRILQARLDLAQRRGRTVPQTEIAEAVGVSSVTLGYWEREKTEPGDVATWKRLAKALHTTPEWLAFGAAPVTKHEPPPQATPHVTPITGKKGRAG